MAKEKNNIKGYKITNRYSDSDETDKQGRWQRLVWYNGFQLAVISGHVKLKGRPLNIRKTGVINLFQLSLDFPIKDDERCMFVDYNECIIYIEKQFELFKYGINE